MKWKNNETQIVIFFYLSLAVYNLINFIDSTSNVNRQVEMSVFKSLVYTWSTQIISIIKEVKLFYRLFFLPHEPIFLNMILNLFSPHKQLRESSCQATACRLSNRQGIPVPWRQLPQACKFYPTSRFPQQPPHMPSLAFWILLDVLNLSVVWAPHKQDRNKSFSHPFFLSPPTSPGPWIFHPSSRSCCVILSGCWMPTVLWCLPR